MNTTKLWINKLNSTVNEYFKIEKSFDVYARKNWKQRRIKKYKTQILFKNEFVHSKKTVFIQINYGL